jgi:hypothetical protein
MPKCLKCDEEILRGNYCEAHRVESGSTLGVVIENNDRVERGGGDIIERGRINHEELDPGVSRKIYRGE